MNRLHRVFSVVTTIALGLGGVVAASSPVAAAVPPVGVDVRFSCDITTDATGFVANQANGVQEHDAFRFRLTVAAPTVVEPGQEFDYVLTPGFVGLPNPLATRSASVTLNAMEQARLSLQLPTNAEVTDITLSGGTPGVVVERTGGVASIHGGSTTDEMNSRNPGTIKKKDNKGLQGVARGGRMGFDLPEVRLRMRAGQVGTIQPTFPQVANPKEHHYPAGDSFFTMLGDASALFFTPLALVRCTPIDFTGLPAVRVVDSAQVSGDTTAIALTAQPEVGRPGEPSVLRLRASDATGQPVAGEPMVVSVGDERQLVITGGDGTATVPVVRADPGEVLITARVGEVTAEFTYRFSANPDVVTTSVQVPMVCRVSPSAQDADPQKVQVVDTHVRGVHGPAPGAKVDPGFLVAMTVTAPRQVRVGEEFDYDLRPVVFSARRANERTHFLQVVYEGFDHGRVALHAPGGARLLGAAAEGGQVTTAGDRITVFDGVTADDIDPGDEATIGALVPAGAMSVVAGERVSLPLPASTVRLVADAPGTVAPTLSQESPVATLTQGEAALTFAGTVAVEGTYRPELNRSVRALFICDPAKEVALPAVAVLPALAGVAISAPQQVAVGETTTVVATVRDTTGGPASGVRVELAVGETTIVARTDDNGQVTVPVAAAEPGPLVVGATAGEHHAIHTMEVTAPEVPQVQPPPWWRVLVDAVPGGWVTVIAGLVGAIALVLGVVHAATGAGLLPRSS